MRFLCLLYKLFSTWSVLSSIKSKLQRKYISQTPAQYIPLLVIKIIISKLLAKKFSPNSLSLPHLAKVCTKEICFPMVIRWRTLATNRRAIFNSISRGQGATKAINHTRLLITVSDRLRLISGKISGWRARLDILLTSPSYSPSHRDNTTVRIKNRWIFVSLIYRQLHVCPLTWLPFCAYGPLICPWLYIECYASNA